MTAISTSELAERLSDPNVTIVDVRPLAAYNGWRLNGERRGGHIPGAVAFPSAWLLSVDAGEIDRLLQSKGIVPGRSIVVYGDDLETSAFTTKLEVLGLEDVSVYEAGFGTWAGDEQLPIERLAKYDSLVHTEWLRQVLHGEKPESAPDDGKFLLFHVNFGVPEEYAEGHIPGRSISTPTGSRIRLTGTAGHPRRSRPGCAPWASRMTPRSSSTGATPRATPTRNGRAAGPARSRPRGR